MKPAQILLCSLILGTALATPAAADIINLQASMDGAQADAGAGISTPGTGSAVISYNTVTNALSWSLTWNDLTGTATAIHFHGPALPDETAGIQVYLDLGPQPLEGNASITESQEADLLDGLWYINVHTAKYPSGEIRGQVLQPIPTRDTTWGAIKLAPFRATN